MQKTRLPRRTAMSPEKLKEDMPQPPPLTAAPVNVYPSTGSTTSRTQSPPPLTAAPHQGLDVMMIGDDDGPNDVAGTSAAATVSIFLISIRK